MFINCTSYILSTCEQYYLRSYKKKCKIITIVQSHSYLFHKCKLKMWQCYKLHFFYLWFGAFFMFPNILSTVKKNVLVIQCWRQITLIIVMDWTLYSVVFRLVYESHGQWANYILQRLHFFHKSCFTLSITVSN